MNVTNMRHKDLTYNISGSRVWLKPIVRTSDGSNRLEIRIEGLIDDTLTLEYINKETLSRDMEAFSHLFYRLYLLQPQAWGNSEGVMSRGEIQLMRLAILCGGIAVLTCLVYLLVILFK